LVATPLKQSARDENGGMPAGGHCEHATEEGACAARPPREGPAPGTVGALETQRRDSDRREASRAQRFESLAVHPGPIHPQGVTARAAPGEQDATADRRKGGALSREANKVMRSPPPAPEGTGLAGRLALSARSSDGTASTFARFLTMHPGQPPSRPCPVGG